MSGTFENINVPPMLMAFGITTVDAGQVISPELKYEGIGKRNDGTGMEEEMKEESPPVGRPIHRRRTRKGCALSEVLQEITASASVQQRDEKENLQSFE